MDPLALAATLAASVAASAACTTVWQAHRTGKDLHAASSTLRDVLNQGHRIVELQDQAIVEQRSSARQMEATVSTLRDVLREATQLVELQRASLAELRTVVTEQRQLATQSRLHRQVDRLTVVGERVEELRLACEQYRLELLYGRDTTYSIAAAMARLAVAIAATGGESRLPNSTTLAHGHANDYARNGVDVLAARSEVRAAIAAVSGDGGEADHP